MSGYREDHERYHKHGRSTDDEPLAVAAIPDNPGYPHDYGLPCSCAECGASFGPHDCAKDMPNEVECGFCGWHAWPDNLDGVAPHIPGTDYYDGRDGSIEAEDDCGACIHDRATHGLNATDTIRPCRECNCPDFLRYDDEDRIEAEDEARREEWSEFLEWQRSLGA